MTCVLVGTPGDVSNFLVGYVSVSYFLKMAFGHLLLNRHMVLLCVLCRFLV